MPEREDMTTTVGSALAHDPSASDVYDPDDVLPQNSPLMKAHRPKLEPSPSPPAIPLPKVSLLSQNGRKSSNRRQKIRPSLGDAVLIHYLDGGKRPDIVAEAWSKPLSFHGDDDDAHSKGDTETEETVDGSGDEEDTRSHEEMSPVPTQRRPTRATDASVTKSIDLQFLATNAVGMLAAKAASKVVDSTDCSQAPDDASTAAQRTIQGHGSRIDGAREDTAMKDANRPVLAAPISPYPSQSSQEMFSPRNFTSGQGMLMHPNSIQRSPPALSPSTGHGDLPPIQEASPKSDTTNHESLPSIRSTLFEQLTGPPKDLAMRQFPHSPPGGPPRMGGIPGNHASPPISPNDSYRHSSQSIPSPPHTIPAMSPYGFPPQHSTNQYRPNMDYSSSSNANTPSGSGDASTPATSVTITERMSIDAISNPVGAFMCTVQGCNAPPFQTQYLLNSHANVHSSARPHYCSVKGCPRSEGGKGFKRKNEMIRHGLVHDSPGYVCPFCPDREHKYPRPDNLQR